MDIRSIVGTNIRKIRTKSRLSQEELAHRAGVDRPHLSQIENGLRNVGIVTLSHIAGALKVKITELFHGYK